MIMCASTTQQSHREAGGQGWDRGGGNGVREKPMGWGRVLEAESTSVTSIRDGDHLFWLGT